jgi:hypothetical protein
MAGNSGQKADEARKLVEGDGSVTLHVTAGEARRIVRALEQTSLSLCGSPSGSKLASSYMRLATTIRRQAASV